MSLVRSIFRGLITAIVMAAPAFAQQPPGVSLKVRNETAPAGAIAQMKVVVTEPKPITTGSASFSFDGFSDLAGVSLPAGDGAGLVVVRGSQLALSVISPTASLGLDPDYPLLTLTGRVPASAPTGFRFPLTLDPNALTLTDPNGAVYPVEVRGGYLQVGGTLSVANVLPGSGELNAGDVVSILGTGFRPDTRVRFTETVLSDVQFISAERIDVTLAEPTQMHGKTVRIKNGDGQQVSYYSYQRTYRASPSADPLLRDMVPIFPSTTAPVHQIDIDAESVGLAMQNLGGADAQVVAELFDLNGTLLASAPVVVPSRAYLVLSLQEVFGWSPQSTAVLRLASSTAVHVLGVEVDAAGRFAPRLARP